MRVGVTSRYNSQTLTLLDFMAIRLGVDRKEAQRAAVVAMAREMIKQDRKAANANPATAAETGEPPAVQGEDPSGVAVQLGAGSDSAGNGTE